MSICSSIVKSSHYFQYDLCLDLKYYYKFPNDKHQDSGEETQRGKPSTSHCSISLFHSRLGEAEQCFWHPFGAIVDIVRIQNSGFLEVRRE